MTEKPSEPQNFEIAYTEKDSVTLQWKKPKSDGGAMISKYILEQKKGKLGSWTKVKELESYQHSATIKHLEPDCEYGFRVKAKNSEGFSEAVELESSIKSSKPPGDLSFISKTNV